MNTSTTKYKIEVMQASEDGETIERNLFESKPFESDPFRVDGWEVDLILEWNWSDFMYRIKPKNTNDKFKEKFGYTLNELEKMYILENGSGIAREITGFDFKSIRISNNNLWFNGLSELKNFNYKLIKDLNEA